MGFKPNINNNIFVQILNINFQLFIQPYHLFKSIHQNNSNLIKNRQILWKKSYKQDKNLKQSNSYNLKFNNMKSINQFDYPSKEAQSFKASSLLSDSQDNKDYIKTRYKQNLQYHMELQRFKAKQNQKLKQQLQSKKKKDQLQSQLQNKKRQLQNLEVLKQQAEQNQKKSYELALLKQQQDRIKKNQNQLRKQQFDQNAAVRFTEAMKKLQSEKEENSFKQRLAEQRRKTAQQFQKIERAKAEKYRSFVEDKQKNNEREKQSGPEQYCKTFKQYLTSPNQDYNRTCLHNLKVVSQIKKQQENAFEKGRVQADEVKQKSEERKRHKEQNDRRSKERGREALLRIQREKQYENFEKQTSQEQKKYNYERIEAGKKNQFVGIKPTTLTQMQISKKIRSEEQFDKMFFSSSVQPAENANKAATKYQIIEKRIPPPNHQNSDSDQKPRKIKSYLKKRQQSEMPAVSQGKYSFEQQCYSQFKSQSQSQSHIHDQTQENQQVDGQANQYERTNLKNTLKQTRIPDEKPRISPEQQKNGYYKEQKPVKGSKNIKDDLKKSNLNQEQAFDTNEMLKKYGLNREKFQKSKGPGEREEKKAENKRKVVELANICQNRQGEKQELNYSSQSEEDSLS